ncbi:MAG: protein translocase subunit SecD [Frankiaceae bacterium]
MASANTPRPGRALAFVALVLVALYIGVFLSKSHTPQLGLDLRGGTSVTLTPKVTKGKVSKQALAKAVDIIRLRVDHLGVSEAEVATEGNNIVVSVPGKGRSDVLDLVRRTAQLRFRQVLAAAPATAATPSASPSAGRSATVSPSGKASSSTNSVPSTTASPRPSTTGNGRAVPPALGQPPAAVTPRPTPSVTAPVRPATPTLPATAPANVSASVSANEAKLAKQFATINCSTAANRQGTGLDDPQAELVACSRQGDTKYLLAKAAVLGTDVRTASATVDQQGLGHWQVILDFNGKGAKQFGNLTKRVQPLPDINTSGCQPPTGCNGVAVVLDGVVQSAPRIVEPILDGRAQITGNFSEKDAKDLANILKYGALPLAFDVPTAQTISPTLGSDQLHGGLIAGAIGLGLVVLYSLLYYRGLGLVTVASLVLSGLIIYAATVLLGHAIHYTLSLAGIAGFIVAVGITADSFVVFFERLRDEVREGRSLRSSVERGWVRARRTILSADTVSLLAAVVLYVVSIGNVRGFAFTLGLSTVVDLFIVFLFTKPLVALLARTRLFGSGGRFSGLSPGRLGSPPPILTGGRTRRASTARPPGRPRSGSRSVGEV